MSKYALALSFDTDDPQFVRGVEIGRLWEIVKNTPETFEATVHIVNAEMVIRIAEAENRSMVSREVDDTWMVIKFGKAPDG